MIVSEEIYYTNLAISAKLPIIAINETFRKPNIISIKEIIKFTSYKRIANSN